jgi:phospholipase/carboxylesterase
VPATPNDPHRDQPVLTTGAPLAAARGALIMLHGRGAGAADIIGLSQVIDRANVAYFAPEAAGRVWYPRPFMSPAAENEPYLSSALAVVARLISQIAAAGIPVERIAILGFSQGACLGLEFVARNPRRYGAVLALSGGLIGDEVAASNYSGSLAGTPVFAGVSDVDPFIPLTRVEESMAVMRALAGEVTERVYPGAAHTIVAEEIAIVQRLLDAMIGEPAA